jgi:Pyruvate/2-oxoacid:ferredoxin oxidoreductase gamma subunit
MAEKKQDSKSRKEEFKLTGSELIEKIKELIHQGNIRRLILKNEEGKTLIEIPLTLGLVGAALLPLYAAVGAIAALVAKMTLVVEKEEEEEDKKEGKGNRQ